MSRATPSRVTLRLRAGRLTSWAGEVQAAGKVERISMHTVIVWWDLSESAQTIESLRT